MTDIEPAFEARAKDRTYVHQVRAGGVYEIRIALQAQADARVGEGIDGGIGALGVTFVPLEFRDRDGARLDPRLICNQPSIPGLDPLEIETLPICHTEGQLDDRAMAGALASRFFIAPPDAAELQLGPIPDGVALLRHEVQPLNVNWASTGAARNILTSVRAQCKQRGALLDAILKNTAEAASPAMDLLSRIPPRQIEAIIARFKPGGNWTDVLDPDDLEAAATDYRRRMDRLRAQATHLRKVGFIGSDRGLERLDGMAEVYRLRQSRLADQMQLLDLDLIVIETGAPCSPEDDDRDWPLAFSDPQGNLPATGAALMDMAKAQGVPVHLWFTGAAETARYWHGCAARATRIIAEGTPEEWAGIKGGFPQSAHIVPRATCPAACSVGSLRPRQSDRMLVPAAADILQYPDLADLIAENGVCQPLLTEFRYRFGAQTLSLRLQDKYRPTIGDHTRSQERLMLQSGDLVLIPAQSLRPDAELVAVALDAIASGAVPVIFGVPRSNDRLLHMLDRVYGIADLIELQALYRAPWLLERRWRKLMRYVMQSHVWTAPHRAALLGRDPFPDGFDTPRISAVLITKRPHLLKACLDSFRKQSWPDKELVLVFNTGSIPADLPVLRENEHILALPVSSNIGECLNRAIAYSTGRYWAKMDDDDFYSRTYLEETINYYRSSQADSVGRSSAFFYFSGPDETRVRPRVGGFRNQLMKTGYLSGASLSGDRKWLSMPFSFKDRSAADSNWITSVLNTGHSALCGDSTSLVVFRAKDESMHTWQIGRSAQTIKKFRTFSNGQITDRMEFEP